MCVKTRQEGTMLVVMLTEKRLDAALAAKFKDQMKEIIESGQQFIILDLKNVDFIDSSGLGAIV